MSCWVIEQDEASGYDYYVNQLTGESSWECPAEIQNQFDSQIGDHQTQSENLKAARSKQTGNIGDDNFDRVDESVHQMEASGSRPDGNLQIDECEKVVDEHTIEPDKLLQESQESALVRFHEKSELDDHQTQSENLKTSRSKQAGNIGDDNFDRVDESVQQMEASGSRPDGNLQIDEFDKLLQGKVHVDSQIGLSQESAPVRFHEKSESHVLGDHELARQIDEFELNNSSDQIVDNEIELGVEPDKLLQEKVHVDSQIGLSQGSSVVLDDHQTTENLKTARSTDDRHTSDRSCQQDEFEKVVLASDQLNQHTGIVDGEKEHGVEPNNTLLQEKVQSDSQTGLQQSEGHALDEHRTSDGNDRMKAHGDNSANKNVLKQGIRKGRKRLQKKKLKKVTRTTERAPDLKKLEKHKTTSKASSKKPDSVIHESTAFRRWRKQIDRDHRLARSEEKNDIEKLANERRDRIHRRVADLVEIQKQSKLRYRQRQAQKRILVEESKMKTRNHLELRRELFATASRRQNTFEQKFIKQLVASKHATDSQSRKTYAEWKKTKTRQRSQNKGVKLPMIDLSSYS